MLTKELYLALTRARTRASQEFYTFYCHKCHTNHHSQLIINGLYQIERIFNQNRSLYRSSSKNKGQKKRTLLYNNTLFWEKRHVVLKKTTRCFEENDTLFWRKRHVVLRKTTHCFEKNYTSVSMSLKNQRSVDWKSDFYDAFCSEGVTLVTAKNTNCRRVCA